MVSNSRIVDIEHAKLKFEQYKEWYGEDWKILITNVLHIINNLQELNYCEHVMCPYRTERKKETHESSHPNR